MLSLILSAILMVLAYVPLQIVRWLRRRQMREGAVVRIDLRASRRPLTTMGHLRRIELLHALARDGESRAVLVHLEETPHGWAALQDLRNALAAVRAAGKEVFFFLEQGGNRDLYLTSVGRAWMPPVGELFLTGMGARMNFLAGALERFGVKVDLEAAGAYKSFGETFTRRFASPANREQTEYLLGDLQDQLVEAIAEGRKIPASRVRELMNRSPIPSAEAAQHGLIDGVAYEDQLERKLQDALGQEVRFVPWGRYARLARWEQRLAGLGPKRRRAVAVVHLEGAIVMGGAEAQGGRRIEAREVVPALEALLKEDRVQAVVLHVDSPGGSAVASDLIARAVRRLGQARPVLACYGNVSASGGYYLSVPAREIIAQPGTITGSIGVVGGKLVVGEALARQGVTGDTVAVGPDVGFLQPWEPFSDDQRVRFRGYLERTYDTFLQTVANGRRCPVAAIEPHAAGRVWTGRQAKDRGLVDHLGGLDLAIRRARLLAGLQEGEGDVLHIDFTPSRFRALAQLANRGQIPGVAAIFPALSGVQAMLARRILGRTGAAEAALGLLAALPGQALALLPWVIEDER